MGKNRGLLLRALLLLVFVCVVLNTTRATETFAPTSFTSGSVTFDGIDVYSANSFPASNPFGVTQPVCQDYPCGDVLGSSYEVANITFFAGGGFQIVETAAASNGNWVSVYENAGLCDGSAAIFTVSSSLTVSTPVPVTECVNPSTVPIPPAVVYGTGWIFNVGYGYPQAGTAYLTFLGTVNGYGGVFSAEDNSEDIAFSLGDPLSPTPELPSLFLFGTGLLGVGFLLRRGSVRHRQRS